MNGMIYPYIIINRTSPLSDDGSPILTREQFLLPEVLNDGEVLLRLDGATICNSDVHTMTGRRKVTIILTSMMMMMMTSGAHPRGAGSRGLWGGGEERQARDHRRGETHLLRDRRVWKVRV